MKITWREKHKEIILILIIAFAVFSHNKLTPWHQLINSDGKGYYAYLPALFIYNDNTHGFIDVYESKYYSEESYLDFRETYKDEKVNKCFSGVAFLLLPFFFLSHFAANISGLPVDGYSPIYQYGVLAAAIFYFYLGLFFSQKVMESLQLANKNISLALLLIVFGTNLLHYTVHEPSMSHVYSFFAISFFAFTIIKLKENVTGRNMIMAAFCLGIIILIRPTNIIVLLLIPFLMSSYSSLVTTFKGVFNHPEFLALSIFIIMAIAGIQSVLWYWQSGYFIIRPYGNEGFNFLSPKFFHVLFSYRKGLFLYTPLLFISLAGFYFIYKQDKFRAGWLFLFLLALVYLVSSWWYWAYGMSFGHRAFVDFFLVFAILMAFSLENFKGKFNYAFLSLCGLALLFNQVQNYQYNHYILLWDGMTKDKYWQVFLKTSFKYEGMLWEEIKENEETELPQPKELLFNAFTNFDSPHELWGGDIPLTEKYTYSGKFSTLTNVDIPYSATFQLPLNDMILPEPTLLEINSKVYYERIRNGTQLVVTIESDGDLVFFEPVRINTLVKVPRQWEDLHHRLLLPELQGGENHILKVFAFNNEKKKPVYLDDMEIKLYSVAIP